MNEIHRVISNEKTRFNRQQLVQRVCNHLLFVREKQDGMNTSSSFFRFKTYLFIE